MKCSYGLISTFILAEVRPVHLFIYPHLVGPHSVSGTALDSKERMFLYYT